MDTFSEDNYDNKFDRSNIPSNNKPQYDQYVVPMKKGNLAVFDEKAQILEENFDVKDDQLDNLSTEDSVRLQEDNSDKNENIQSDQEQRLKRRDLLDEQKREIYDFYTNLNKKTAVYGLRKKVPSNNFKKVQVQEEETGTQRVQVNAGYENPRIACESGYNSCSGVVLKWVLTLYGTGE